MEAVYYAVAAVAGMIVGALVTKSLAKPKTVAPPPAPVEPPKPKATKPDGTPLRLLALLQTESRLMDFLMENITAYDDAQIGQAVRDIHAKAQGALKQHLVLEPVVAGTEGATVSVPKGFDPSAIRVLGNVTGEPPYSGEVQHPGWRVKSFKLPPAPAGADDFILQPAEVQVV